MAVRISFNLATGQTDLSSTSRNLVATHAAGSRQAQSNALPTQRLD